MSENDPAQREVFQRLAGDFFERYKALSDQPFDHYVTDTWRGFNAQIERALLPTPSFAFLKDPTLRMAMFVTAAGQRMEEQWSFLEERLGREAAAAWVHEDPTGGPTIHAADRMTSHNSIHHAYHLERYDADKGGLWEGDRVIEWGGGYGNLAKLYVRRHTDRPTYTIIDTPLFSCLQWLYLSSVLGEDHVNLLLTPDDQVAEGRVNLIPLGLFDIHANALRADLFISTWALSESGAVSVSRVHESNWFEAPKLLLAYQDPCPEHPCAGLVARHAALAGAVSHPLPSIPGNRYSFR